MANQQLIDFIKQQLQKGLTKEIISNQLLSNGWNTQDIEEGFNYLSSQKESVTQNVTLEKGSNKNTIKIVVFVILVFVILGGGIFAYYFWGKTNKLSEVENSYSQKEKSVNPENQTEEQDIGLTSNEEEKTKLPEENTTEPLETDKKNTQTPVVSNTTNNTQTTTNKIIDCGTDLNCFIKSANSCQKSSVNFKVNQETPLFNVGIIDMITHWEIINKDINNCVARAKVTKYELRYNEEMISSLLKQGKTQGEIDDMQKEMSESIVGSGQICKLSLSKKMGDVLNKEVFNPTSTKVSFSTSSSIVNYDSGLACEQFSQLSDN